MRSAHPLQLNGQPIYTTGCSNLREYTRWSWPEVSLADQRRHPRCMACLGCRCDHRHFGAVPTRQRFRRVTCGHLRLGARARCVQGARQQAGRSSAIDTNQRSSRAGLVLFGATECSPRFDSPIHEVLFEMTGWGVRSHFECIRQRQRECVALESQHIVAGGQSIVIGVAGGRQGISTAVQLIRPPGGARFGGVKAALFEAWWRTQ